MRWGVLWRRVTSRHVRPSASRWVLIRDRDGKTWAGPYRWQGQTFTTSERFWYLFANVESANAAIIGSGFVGVSVLQIV